MVSSTHHGVRSRRRLITGGLICSKPLEVAVSAVCSWVLDITGERIDGVRVASPAAKSVCPASVLLARCSTPFAERLPVH